MALGWIEVAHCTEKWKEQSVALLFLTNDLVGCYIRKNVLVHGHSIPNNLFCDHLLSTVLFHGQVESAVCSLIININYLKKLLI